MISYTLKEKVEGEAQKIVKQGHSHEFTMEDVAAHIIKLAKMKKEITSQKELEYAKMENIKGFNSFLSDLTDEQLNAAYMYALSNKVFKSCVEKLGEIEEAEKEYSDEIVEIEKQTGAVLPVA